MIQEGESLCINTVGMNTLHDSKQVWIKINLSLPSCISQLFQVSEQD